MDPVVDTLTVFWGTNAPWEQCEIGDLGERTGLVPKSGSLEMWSAWGEMWN